MGVIPDEVRGTVTQEICLRLFLGQPRSCEPILVRPINTRRLDTVLPEMIVVVRLNVSMLPFGCPNPVEVFHTYPFVKSMLLDHVVAEVPLAEIGAVVVLADTFGDGRAVGRQRDVVAMETDGVRIQTSHN